MIFFKQKFQCCFNCIVCFHESWSMLMVYSSLTHKQQPEINKMLLES